MANRREFIQGAVAVAAVPLVSGAALVPAFGDGVRWTAPAAISRAVFDQRFAPAESFARRAAAEGARVAAIKVDITSLWYGDLHPAWQRSPQAIAGLTEPGALFCLERLAWDHKMRASFHAEHRFRPGGEVEHKIHISDGAIGREDLDTAGDRWAEVLALHLIHDTGEARGFATVMPPRSSTEETLTLVSWALAPQSRSIV